jgi:hypothetical protein
MHVPVPPIATPFDQIECHVVTDPFCDDIFHFVERVLYV